MDVFTQILAFIITVLVLVSIHEAGHFVVAKLLGMKVLRFSVGFGKAIFKFHDKKGTEYVIAFIPLGGYVKLLDEREVAVPEAEKHLAFNRQPLWARTLVVLAGPMTNLLFAILAFWLMFMVGIESLRPVVGSVQPNSIAARAGLQPGDEIIKVDGTPTLTMQQVVMRVVERLGEKDSMDIEAISALTHLPVHYNLNLQNWVVNQLNPAPLTSLGIEPLRPEIPAIIGTIAPQSPAQVAGLLPKDKILTLNNQRIANWYDLVAMIHANPGKTVTVTYARNNKSESKRITIQKKSAGLRYVGSIGVKPPPISIPANMITLRKYPPFPALGVATNETWQFLVFNFVVLKKMIMGQVSLSSLGGPITIFQTADDAFRQGASVFLGFLALISVMLAFINVLPIPGLDGGHLLNFLIEFIIRRPLSLRFEMISVQVGIFLLIMLMVLATFNDILRLFGGSPPS
ncbi:MAG: RIP metalloprotease RseP [Gammaproteobacteria bacterium]|nr:RIP metalloprotease RseP [Gammaproteobacteria bacterium]